MVADYPDKKSEQGLTAQALDALLAFLDPDRETAGQKYELIRLKLTKYFEWEGCAGVEELADEAINRVARAVERGKEIRDVQAYFYGVARLIHFEFLRDAEKHRRAVAEASASQPVLEGAVPADNESEAAIECLERCLESLPGQSRDLITRYYQGDQIAKIRNRRDLAAALGLASNALRNRALRLRSKLEGCVVQCLKQRDELVDSGTNIYGQ